MTNNEYRTGDRVTVVKCDDFPSYVGRTGVLFSKDGTDGMGAPHPHLVQFDGQEYDYFAAEELSHAAPEEPAYTDVERRSLAYALGLAAGLSGNKEFWNNLYTKVLG